MRIADPIAAAVLRQLRSDQSAHGTRLDMVLQPGDAGTRQTIAAMRAMVHDAAKSPRVHQVATTIAGQADNRDREAQLLALDRFIRECIHFKPDTLGAEVLRHPDQIIAEIAANGRTSCDCDDVAMFGASVCMVLGVQPAFITVAAEPDGPFVHVHYAAILNGRMIPFDPQERVPPGVWTPAARRAGFRV